MRWRTAIFTRALGPWVETGRGATPLGCPQPVTHAEVPPFTGIVDESGFGEAAGARTTCPQNPMLSMLVPQQSAKRGVQCLDALFPGGSLTEPSSAQSGAVAHGTAQQGDESVEVAVVDVVEAARLGDLEQRRMGWADRDHGDAGGEIVVGLCWDAGFHSAGVIDGHDGGVSVLESLVEFSPGPGDLG